jgi:uncharacterized protein
MPLAEGAANSNGEAEITMRSSLIRSLGLALVLGAITPALTTGCGDTGPGEAGADATATKGRFEIFVGEDGQHYFQLLAGNGEKVLRSEGYTTKSACKNGIDSVIANGATVARYKVLPAQNGDYYFNLTAKNGKVIGTSEMYTTKSGANTGRDNIISIIATATVAELTASTESLFEIFKGAGNKTYFRLRAKNGEIVLQSQAYSSKGAAEAGVASVKENGVAIGAYELLEAKNGQSYFHLKAANGEIIARGEMYSTEANAERGIEAVRTIIRGITNWETPSDEQVQAAIEKGAEGANYTSESDYGYTFVSAPLSGQTEITADLVQELMASYVDGDPDTDKPMAELYSMEGKWTEWIADDANCEEQEDEWYRELCFEQAEMDRALIDNLTDIKVFYYGSNGEPGSVDGVAVSIIIVGITPMGTLAGVRTIAIWT